MRILITNDDGLHAEGVVRLSEALRELGELLVVLPDRQRSGASHSVTEVEPLRLKATSILDGLPAYITNGTPADCVALAACELEGGRIDLVVSGTNHGWNLGTDALHSGTVMAAGEASLFGLPAVAISVDGREPTRFKTAAWFARRLAKKVLQRGLPRGTFLNVNLPDLPRDQIKGVAITSLSLSTFCEPFEKRSDPHGGTYYWRGGPVPIRFKSDGTATHNGQPGTDSYAVFQGFISVTPLRLDPTDTDSLGTLRSQEWGWDKPNDDDIKNA